MVDKMSVSPHLIHISNPFISRKKMCFGMFLATSSSSSPQHWQHWNMSTQRDRSEAHCLNPTVEGSVEHCWIFSWCMCPTHCFTFVLAHFGENLLDCRWENIYWNWLLNMRSESVSCFWCFRAKCISQAKPTTKQSTVPLSSWSQSHTLRLFFTVDLFKVSHKQPLLSPHPWTSWTSSSSHESWGFTKRTSPSALTKRYHFARLWTSDLAGFRYPIPRVCFLRASADLSSCSKRDGYLVVLLFVVGLSSKVLKRVSICIWYLILYQDQ